MRGVIVLLMAVLAGCYYMAPLPVQQGTLTVRIAWPYDSTEIYNKGDRVAQAEIMPDSTGPIYESLQDYNQGHDPPGYVVSSDSPWGPPGTPFPFITPDPEWQWWWTRIQ